MQVIHYIDRNLLYVKVMQLQPFPAFRKKDDTMPPKRQWRQPILSAREINQNGAIDCVTFNEMSLEHLDELIDGLQAAKETLQNHLDNGS
jgi:hypothetical protein